MNQTPPLAPQKPPTAPIAPPSVWERLVDDLHKRPRRYINGVVVLAIPILLIVLGYKFWSDKRADSAGNLATKWQEIWAPENDAKVRAARLGELEPELKTEDQRALRLFDLARTYRDMADAATTNDEKVSAYTQLLSTVQELKSKYPNSLWVKMPVRPPTAPGAVSLSFAGQLEDLAQRQLAWFKDHPYQGTVEPDANLKATIELEDGRKIVVGKFFSKVAPFHVQNWVELARKGYFDGTAFSKVHQSYKKGADRKQGDRPPNIAAEGGHPMTKLTPDGRDDDEGPNDIGYSVREEPNMLAIKRGSIVAVQDYATGGDSPSRFKVFAEEPEMAQDTVFAEVTEGLEVLDAIVNATPPEGHPQWTKDLVRIKKVTVEGSVGSPPDRAFPPELRMPELPKPESAESKPESVESRGTGPDTKPDRDTVPKSGPDTKPK
jgi:peptidyl-prolyl cis-trans isomerase B (cyclophilin B)